ncbi:unnamed protein product [Rangifer tarandus platyrhynchus]|uniref:Uncharacterized protein n=1 Tax=Rangifer tarandus platyrhynchus TaxID=3082113 RepID=A0ABN8ZI15_RANTA|nr:unnamed protein product [Rangifer tarandus platyrhynchus]
MEPRPSPRGLSVPHQIQLHYQHHRAMMIRDTVQEATVPSCGDCASLSALPPLVCLHLQGEELSPPAPAPKLRSGRAAGQGDGRGPSELGLTPSGKEAVGGAAGEVRGPERPSEGEEEACAAEPRSHKEAQAP